MAHNRGKMQPSSFFGVCLVILITVALVCGMLWECRKQEIKNAAYAQEEQRYSEKIAAEKERAAEIEENSRYVKTEEFYVKMAHQRFGLVAEDEWVVKPTE